MGFLPPGGGGGVGPPPWPCEVSERYVSPQTEAEEEQRLFKGIKPLRGSDCNQLAANELISKHRKPLLSRSHRGRPSTPPTLRAHQGDLSPGPPLR